MAVVKHWLKFQAQAKLLAASLTLEEAMTRGAQWTSFVVINDHWLTIAGDSPSKMEGSACGSPTFPVPHHDQPAVPHPMLFPWELPTKPVRLKHSSDDA